MYSIRPYRESDRARVEAVCLSPDEPRFGKKAGIRSPMDSALLAVFCAYYVEQEPQNCFVAANDADEAVGYILCTRDFAVWERDFTRLYLQKTLNPITKAMGKGTVEGLRAFSGEYPAHLHIDLAAECRRQGLGTRLMDELLIRLAAEGVPGVMLQVEAANEKARSFYRKLGFEELEVSEQVVTMGKKLGAAAVAEEAAAAADGSLSKN